MGSRWSRVSNSIVQSDPQALMELVQLGLAVIVSAAEGVGVAGGCRACLALPDAGGRHWVSVGTA